MEFRKSNRIHETTPDAGLLDQATGMSIESVDNSFCKFTVHDLTKNVVKSKYRHQHFYQFSSDANDQFRHFYKRRCHTCLHDTGKGVDVLICLQPHGFRVWVLIQYKDVVLPV